MITEVQRLDASAPRTPRAEQAVLKDLAALRKDRDLDRLDEMLRQFNVFRVLRFEDVEIRHSNMLAWLLQPDESHGLGDLFLRRWLALVVKDSEAVSRFGLLPLEIETCTIQKVEVVREWNHLDLLVKIATEEHVQWVVAIENKLRSNQLDNQLAGYRKSVESAFPSARKTFIFLTAREEPPHDDAYIPASYRQVHVALSGCLRKRRKRAGTEPGMLIQHYLAILEERCMENPKIAALAQSIYERHRHALDVIIKHRTDPVQRLTDSIAQCIRVAGRRSVIPMAMSIGIARFLPANWDTKPNRAGKAFGEKDSAYVLVELGTRWGPCPWLEVVVSQAPHKKWRRDLYQLSQQNHFSIARWNKGPKDDWMRIYAVKCPIRVDHEQMRDFDGKAKEIWRWCRDEMKKQGFQKVVRLVAAHLRKLPVRKHGGRM